MKNAPPMARKVVVLEPELLEKVRAYSSEDNESGNHIIRRAIREYAERRDAEKKE